MENRNTNCLRTWRLITIPFRPSLTCTLARVDTFTDIKIPFLIQEEIRGLIVDIDGTLVEHGGETLPPDVVEKMWEFINHRIAVCIFSNNLKDRADQFVTLGIKVLKDTPKKPHPHGFLVAMKELGLENPKQCAMVGDDFSTDGGSNNIGIHFIHVKPIPGQVPLWVNITRIYADAWSKIHDLLRRITKKYVNGSY